MALPWPAARWHPLVGGLLLLLVTWIVYTPALDGGFIWDDDQYVEQNPNLGSGEGLRKIWLDVEATPQYYPLVHTSYWIEHSLWGLEPRGYHVTNILLHALSACVLWRLLLVLGVPGAWAGAALFALHPVQVESVAWITERKNVLSGLFYFAAAWVYLRCYLRLDPSGDRDDRPRDDRPRDDRPLRGAWALAFVLFTAALLSKTVTASLPAALLVVLWWKRGRLAGRHVFPLIPFFVIGIAMGLLTAWIEKNYVGAAGAAWGLEPVERLLVAGRALWFYAGKLLWPHPLVFIYPRWELDSGSFVQVLFPLAALALVFLLWRLRHHLGRGPLAAVLLFGGTLTPALGFFDVYPMQYSFVADHFQYLATASLLALGAAGIHRLGRRLPAGEWLAAGILAFLLVVCGTLTWRQCHAYGDVETLWRDTLAKNPDAWMAHNNLGLLLQERGELQAAIEHYRHTTRLAPEYPFGHNNLGTAVREAGNSNEAIDHFRRALELDPDYARAHYNLGAAFAAEGRLASAKIHYLRAISLRPEYSSAHNNLGNTLAMEGRLEEAVFHFSQSLRLRPDGVNTHFNMATALSFLGRGTEAVEHFLAAARLEPEWPAPLLKAAWILATHAEEEVRAPARALELLATAEQLPGGSTAGLLDVRAAALAAAGRFEEAAAVAQRAIEQSRPGDGTDVAAILRRLELYRRDESYVER